MGWPEAKQGIHRLNYYVCAVGMVMLIPLMLLTFADVALRGFFNKPIPGTFELSQYMLAVFILLGAAYTQQVKGHAEIDFLTSRMSPALRSLSKLITTTLGLLIISVLVWQGWVEGIDERTVSDQLRIPQYPFKILVSIGGFLLWLELLIDLVTAFGNLRRNDR
jgi:TRAP-type C4-dicarboxylate transport system permease small subunit